MPWVIPGFAGMLTVLISDKQRRIEHGALISSSLLSIVQYLTYRDLNPHILWHLGCIHYYKFSLLILALYAALYIRAILVLQKYRLASTCLAIVVMAFLWRVELKPVLGDHSSSQVNSRNPMSLAPGFDDLEDDYLIAVERPDLIDLHRPDHTVKVGDEIFRSRFDFYLYRRASEIMIVPLRNLPKGVATVEFAGTDTPHWLHASHRKQRIVLDCHAGSA